MQGLVHSMYDNKQQRVHCVSPTFCHRHSTISNNAVVYGDVTGDNRCMVIILVIENYKKFEMVQSTGMYEGHLLTPILSSSL